MIKARCLMPVSSPIHVRASVRSSRVAAMAPKHEIWDVVTSALESGRPLTLLFGQGGAPLASEWQALGRFRSVFEAEGGQLVDAQGEQVGLLRQLGCAADLRAAEALAREHVGAFVMDATDWKVIPAENLVAAFHSQQGRAQLLAVARDSAAARTFLEALEIGCGVVLDTDDPGQQVRQLAAYLRQREVEAAGALAYEAARVTGVRPVGSGDRACVDLASLCAPGEGLLVGSFARALFLVHSECAESSYIASRPFRVNAGPVGGEPEAAARAWVHAYVQAPGGRTSYLSELRSGSEVLVADAAGRQRAALVGRVKIEARPLVLVEAATRDGAAHSILLQNAETVKLVGPAPGSTSGRDPAQDGHVSQEGPAGSSGGGGGGGRAAPEGAGGNGAGPAAAGGAKRWRAISVSELQPGDEVYVLRQGAARHTGISIEEQITEK
eukprot:scaffold12.g8100.t1